MYFVAISQIDSESSRDLVEHRTAKSQQQRLECFKSFWKVSTSYVKPEFDEVQVGLPAPLGDTSNRHSRKALRMLRHLMVLAVGDDRNGEGPLAPLGVGD